jgi:hypothetical protein
MASRTHSFTTRQKMSRNTFEIFHYRDETVQEVTLHHHDFYEVYFFLSGNVSYNIESRSYRLSPGDILLISPNELHQPIFSPEKQSYERMVLWLNVGFLEQFTTSELDMTRCFNTRGQERANLIRPDGVTRELMTYLIQQLLREQDSEEFGSEIYCLSLLAQLLATADEHKVKVHKTLPLADGQLADTHIHAPLFKAQLHAAYITGVTAMVEHIRI